MQKQNVSLFVRRQSRNRISLFVWVLPLSLFCIACSYISIFRCYQLLYFIPFTIKHNEQRDCIEEVFLSAIEFNHLSLYISDSMKGFQAYNWYQYTTKVCNNTNVYSIN